MTVCDLLHVHKDVSGVPLIQFLSLVEVGITLHIHTAEHDTVYIDKVQNANHMLHLLEKIARKIGRRALVTEVTVFESDSEVGLVVYCK